MAASEWSVPAVLDVVADAVPERDMLVWTTVRRTCAEVRERTRRLAAFLAGRGLGVRRERDALRRWECGQSTVAILLTNCPEYLETMIGAFRARAVPANVNHHYAPHEVGALLGRLDAEAVVYHRRLGPLVAAAGGAGDRLLIDVDDGSGIAPLPGSTPYEEALATATGVDALPVPSPDDLYLVCTGGTTGAPKGVLWRQADLYVSCAGGTEDATRASITAVTANGPAAWFAAPPLMHGAAQWTAFAALHNGATVILHDDAKSFDARAILRTIEKERVSMMSMVGDAYARPLVEELRTGAYDLTSLVRVGTGGATTSAALKHELLEMLPHLTVVDGYGASETGGMAFGASTRGRETRGFRPSAGAAVLSFDRTRFLEPGEDEIGWTARVGRTPLGYLGDRGRTEETFPVIDGRRAAVPGDRARYLADGTIEMLGRDAMVVNTGGEKVFVEEVEEVLRLHPGVADALVVGRPSERFGQEVVALVQPVPGASPSGRELRAFVADRIARFKAPRAVLVCDRIGRHATGKADYTWAREAAVDAVPVETGAVA